MTTMTPNVKTVKPSKSRSKPQRAVRWVTRPQQNSPYGVVEITLGKEVFLYFARKIPSDYGLGIEMSKLASSGIQEAYHVNVDHDTQAHSCECRGFLRWYHCKHIDSMLALDARGQGL